MRKKILALGLAFSFSAFAQDAGIPVYITDGSASEQDEFASASSSSARFSPDGSRIVFVTQADDFQGPHATVHYYQVAELEIATGQITYIADGDYYQSEPSYSPDGSKILFRTESSNFGKLKYKLDKSGKHTSQIAEWDRKTAKVNYLTDGDFWSDFPEYSPDGNRVVFQTRSAGFSGKFTTRKNEWGDPEQQIAEWDRKTRKVTYVTDGDGESSRPHYSPDGNKIIFTTGASNLAPEPPLRKYQIAEFDRTTGSFRYLTRGDAACSNPSFSPDGKKILFESGSNFDASNYAGKTQIVEMEIASGKITLLTHGDDLSSNPVYSADGKHVVFITRAGNFEGKHTDRKDDYGAIAQIAEWSRSTGKVRYLTDGDKPSLGPSYSKRNASIVFHTQADNFAGTHTPRVEYDLSKNPIAVFQLAMIKR